MGARPLAILLGALVFLGAGATRAESAAQTGFSERRDTSGNLAFHYTFTDQANRRPWELAFDLPASEARRPALGVGRYDNAALIGRISRAVAEAVRAYDGLVTAEVRPADGYKLSVEAKGRYAHPSVINGLKKVADGAAQSYFADSYLKVVRDRVVIPDYGRLAVAYTPTMRPAAEALAALTPGASERQRLALAMVFIQSIPYDTVAATRPGNGYAVPTLLLTENKGDCDTKSVALAALLATLMPAVPTAVVLVPGHALLGVGLPRQPGDQTLRYQGREYVLAEPVGPAQLPPGRVSTLTRTALDRRSEISIEPVAR